MNSQLRNQIEKGTRIAFMHYIVRHLNVADRLQGGCSEVISSMIEVIENDEKVITAIENTPQDKALGKVIEIAEKHLPEVISSLEYNCRPAHLSK